MRMQQLPLTATTISPLPRIPTAQHGCNGCVGKESDRIMTTSERHPKIHRIALVDNDPRALDSLSAVIACKVPTAYVVWTATSGYEAIERCQDANSNVSLLILDMPILGATSFSIKSYRDKLVEAGAQGLVGKENADQLAQIIMRMCNGEVMEGFETPALANLRISREAETAPSLTVREEQIISLCAEGMLDREIAERLGISEATIRKHMQSILRKLNCKTSRQAVALWVRSNAF